MREFSINFRLILRYSNSAESKQGSKQITRLSKNLISSLFYGRLIFALILLSLPANSQASVFSFVNSIFASNRAAASVVNSANSQKMPLLQAALNSDPNPSKSSSQLAVVGGGALITESGPTGGSTVAADKPSSDQISLYTVRAGDTLPGIAQMFGVTANTIKWANNMKPKDVIKKDQVLIILPISGVKYTVKKGDSIKSIAKDFSGDANDIASYNNLADNQKLAVGDEIIIPNGEVSTISETSVKTSGNSVSGKIPQVNVNNTSKSGTPEQTGNDSGPYTDPTGYFRRPLDGGTRTQGLHGHNGVDWGNSVGTPIHAAAAGTVIISKNGGWNGGYGDYVVISHDNGMQTLYAHMKATSVVSGNHVEKGDVIGYIGMTGDTSGPHVHFEVRGGKNPF